MDYLLVSDIASALVGAFYANEFKYMKTDQAAAQAAAVSIVSRVASTLGKDFYGPLNDAQRRGLSVVVLNALAAYYRKASPVKGALNGLSISLLTQEIMALIGMPEYVLWSTKTGVDYSDATQFQDDGHMSVHGRPTAPNMSVPNPFPAYRQTDVHASMVQPQSNVYTPTGAPVNTAGTSNVQGAQGGWFSGRAGVI